MVRNTSSLEDELYTFRQTITDRLRRNIAEEMKSVKSSSRYQQAFGYYALLQNTDSSGSLTLGQIEKIVRDGRQELFQENSILKKGIAALSSFFGKSDSISGTLDALTKYHTSDVKLARYLEKTKTAFAAATHNSVQDDLQGRIQRLERQRERIGEEVLSGKGSLPRYIFEHRGYVQTTSTAIRPPVSRSSWIYSEQRPPYFHRVGLAAASLAAVIGGYLTFSVPPAMTMEPSVSYSLGYTPSPVRPEAPSLPVVPPVLASPEASQKTESIICGSSPNPKQFLLPNGAERAVVLSSIDNWNTASVLREPTATALRDGIYRVEKRNGYADFLFVEHGVIIGTASYKLGQPRFLED
jgi:hypothetical protein